MTRAILSMTLAALALLALAACENTVQGMRSDTQQMEQRIEPTMRRVRGRLLGEEPDAATHEALMEADATAPSMASGDGGTPTVRAGDADTRL
jgi:predicted small secreted protein